MVKHTTGGDPRKQGPGICDRPHSDAIDTGSRRIGADPDAAGGSGRTGPAATGRAGARRWPPTTPMVCFRPLSLSLT